MKKKRAASQITHVRRQPFAPESLCGRNVADLPSVTTAKGFKGLLCKRCLVALKGREL